MNDLLTALQALPVLGPALPYLSAIIAIGAIVATVMPAPKEGASVLYVTLYRLVNLCAANVGHARNAAAAPPLPPAGRSALAFMLVMVLAGCGANGTLTPAAQETVRNVIADGQLFCGVATQAAPLVVAVVNAADAKAVTVTGQTADYVKQACALLGGIPVAPPRAPLMAPVVAVVPPKA